MGAHETAWSETEQQTTSADAACVQQYSNTCRACKHELWLPVILQTTSSVDMQPARRTRTFVIRRSPAPSVKVDKPACCVLHNRVCRIHLFSFPNNSPARGNVRNLWKGQNFSQLMTCHYHPLKNNWRHDQPLLLTFVLFFVLSPITLIFKPVYEPTSSSSPLYFQMLRLKPCPRNGNYSR